MAKIRYVSAYNCSISGCDHPSRLQGEAAPCRMHQARIWKHGDPHVNLAKGPPSGPAKTPQTYLAEYVTERPADGCWIWKGPLDKKGYGVASALRPNGKRGPSRAHRVIYEGLVGPIPQGKLLMHSCDTPPCVNPAHLTPATDAENIGDMVRKGRSARGSKHRAAKLTEAQVMEARRKYASGRYTLAMLAAEYGLTMTPVSQLVRGVTWKHLPLIDRLAA